VSRLRAAFYGDDFTGSVDALLQFARRGWTGRLFVGLPDAADLRSAAAESDVVGIAGIARSLPTEQLEAEIRPVLQALVALEPHVVQYKASSTADSSPTTGSIGRVIELGREVVGDQTVPLVFAQPDFGRYTLHGVHFASEGGVVYRLDRQPTMSTHPTTPMTEADLAVHFSHQTDLAIGRIPFTAYDADLTAQLRGSDAAAVVLDAAIDEHLEQIGRAIDALDVPAFAVGSGGLSLAIAAADGAVPIALPSGTDAAGPVLALSGSRSPQTRRQMDAAAAAEWFVQPLELEPSRASSQLDWVLSALRAGRSVGLSSDDADTSVAEGPVLEAIARGRDPQADRVRRRHVEPGHPPARSRFALDRRQPVGQRRAAPGSLEGPGDRWHGAVAQGRSGRRRRPVREGARRERVTRRAPGRSRS
jgi:uncharacterized protein YgbK (DUF1537 family)